MKISELNVSDGHIINLSIGEDTVTVTLKDWKEKSYRIEFKDVIGLEAYSPENIDLSHIKVATGTDEVKRVCAVVEEDVSKITEYSFFSAWNNISILNIFAEDVHVEE